MARLLFLHRARLRGAARVVALLGVIASPVAAQDLPGAPSRLESRVVGNTVWLTWDAAAGEVTSYSVEAGSSPGAANLAVLTVPGGRLATNGLPAPSGAYFVRVRAVNAAGAGAPSNELTLVVGACAAPPAPPATLAARATGTVASLAWAPSAGATSYVLEAGSSPVQDDIFNADIGGAVSLSAGVLPGAYFVRVRARNACGTSGPSPEAAFTVPAASAPSGLVGAAVGSTVTLAWAPPSAVPTSYVVEVGTATGATNLASIPVAGTATSLSASGVAPGTYFVRVRAVYPSGATGASDEASVTVGAATTSGVTVTFDGIAVNGVPLVSYEEAGVTVTPAAGAWEERTTYGRPAPYVGFTRTGSSNDRATLAVLAGDAPFRAAFLDLYSSVTTIPVVLTGMLGEHVVFSVGTTLPNTFGNFLRVTNPRADAVIDRLLITMTNPSAPNPMGVDNIGLIR